MSDLFHIGSYLFEMEDGVYRLHIKLAASDGCSDDVERMRKALPMIRGKSKSKKDADALLMALAESFESYKELL